LTAIVEAERARVSRRRNLIDPITQTFR
jgi:hypothetical protein